MSESNRGAAALVVTLVGPDRPGLIDRIAAVVAAHQANWLESHMANLAGQFAGIVHIDVDWERQAALRDALHGLSDERFAVTVAQPDGDEPGLPGNTVLLSVTGHDHPGIVRDIAHALAELGVSVDALETRVEHASMSGENLFHADAVLRVPPDRALGEVEATIEALSNEIMVEAVIESAASD